MPKKPPPSGQHSPGTVAQQQASADHYETRLVFLALVILAMLAAVVTSIPLIGAFITGKSLPEIIAAQADKMVGGFIGVMGTLGGVLIARRRGGGEPITADMLQEVLRKVPPQTVPEGDRPAPTAESGTRADEPKAAVPARQEPSDEVVPPAELPADAPWPAVRPPLPPSGDD